MVGGGGGGGGILCAPAVLTVCLWLRVDPVMALFSVTQSAVREACGVTLWLRSGQQ